jgi:hypothetical protein
MLHYVLVGAWPTNQPTKPIDQTKESMNQSTNESMDQRKHQWINELFH